MNHSGESFSHEKYDCYGSGYPPKEESSEAVSAYIGALQEVKDNGETRIKDLKRSVGQDVEGGQHIEMIYSKELDQWLHFADDEYTEAAEKELKTTETFVEQLAAEIERMRAKL